MALNTLTLSTTTGVQGRLFGAVIGGLTTGRVEVLPDSAPGFSIVNGRLSNRSLPYDVTTVGLREYEPGVGQGYRDTRIEITGATVASLKALAAAQIGSGRTLRSFRVAGDRQSDGTIVYSLKVEDDLGSTGNVAIGGTPPTLATLTLSTALTSGSAVSGAILGATSGSTITSNVVGLTVNSAARTFAFDGSAVAGSTANGLVETLAGATNSPFSSPISVAAAVVTPFFGSSSSTWGSSDLVFGMAA